MAIYIEESFFRPILDPWTHGLNRALFIPAANDAGHTIAQLAARALAWSSVSVGTLRALVAAVSTAQPNPSSDKESHCVIKHLGNSVRFGCGLRPFYRGAR